MEALVREHGQLAPDQAMIVVQLAKTNNLLFGGTANFLVAREFSALATYDQKLALMRCLFEVSATDEAISTAEKARSIASPTSCASILPIWSRCALRIGATYLECRARNPRLASNALAAIASRAR